MPSEPAPDGPAGGREGLQKQDALGFIGLGNMGLPIARNLLKGCFRLVAYDRDPARSALIPRSPAYCIGTSPRDVARRCRRSIILVSTHQQLEEVLFSGEGFAAGARGGDSVICMSTVDPIVFRALHDRCAAQGVYLFDAPISGGVDGAVSGTLSVMAGGTAEALQQYRDVIEAVARRTFHVGGVGQGLAMKLVNNMLAQINIIAVCEAFNLGALAGLDPQTMLDVVRESTGNSRVFEGRMPRLIARDFESGGALSISHKDQDLELNFARQLGAPVMMAEASFKVYSMAMEAGLGGSDAAVAVKIYEELSEGKERS